MSKPFKGTINIDIRDSVPDWAPFEPPKAPDGAPNVVYIVLDDVGFSALSPYGGPIPTPNIDRIVADGRALHPDAHDGAVLADPVVPADRAQPHAQQHGVHHRGRRSASRTAAAMIPPENGQISGDPRGRRLEHLHGRQVAPVPEAEMNVASTRRNWPTGRGFERFYGFLGAETNQWYPDLVYDNHPVDPPAHAGGGLPPDEST